MRVAKGVSGTERHNFVSKTQTKRETERQIERESECVCRCTSSSFVFLDMNGVGPGRILVPM